MKRKFFKRTRKSFRKRPSKRPSSTFAKRVKRVERAGKTKWSNASLNSITVGSLVANQVCIPYGGPAQGTARNQRVGNSFVIKSLEFRGSVVGSNADPGPTKTRIIIFIEKVPSLPAGLTPALLTAGSTSQYSMFANSDTTGAYNWISMLNPDTIGSRYRILRDFVVKSNVISATATTGNLQVSYWKKKIVFKNGLKVVTNDTSAAGNPNQINKNQIYVFACCDQAVANGNNLEFDILNKFTDQ